MKIKILQIIIVLLVQSSCTNLDVKPIGKGKEFEFNFVRSGLGSNMGNKDTRLEIKNNEFLYLKQQNSSWSGEYDKVIDTIFHGKVRQSSIDSIITIGNLLAKPKVYRTNSNVLSGGIDYIEIKFSSKSINFTLHNASHPKAEEIIEIVNSNIPDEYDKLILWKNLDDMDIEKTDWKY